MGYVGGIFATVLMMFMLKSETVTINGEEKKVYASDQSFTPVFLIIAAFMLVAVLIMVLTVKENKILAETKIAEEEQKQKRAQNFLNLLSQVLFLFWRRYFCGLQHTTA